MVSCAPFIKIDHTDILQRVWSHMCVGPHLICKQVAKERILDVTGPRFDVLGM